MQSLICELNLLTEHDTVLFRLARDQEAFCNSDLLFLRVTGEFDDLHAVPQRLRDGIHPVCGGHKENLRQVERHVKIVIAERGILFRVEHFHQRC